MLIPCFYDFFHCHSPFVEPNSFTCFADQSLDNYHKVLQSMNPPSQLMNSRERLSSFDFGSEFYPNSLSCLNPAPAVLHLIVNGNTLCFRPKLYFWISYGFSYWLQLFDIFSILQNDLSLL